MKFGLKKKDKATRRVEKKSKRKSGGRKGEGLASLKSFFGDHIEKLLLGTIGVIALILVYSGFRKDTLQTDPDKVKVEIGQAKNSIDSATWAEVKQERHPEPDRFDQNAELDTINIDVASYSARNSLHPIMQNQNKRRSDPDLLAPFDIEVVPGYGALAVKSTSNDSNISDIVGRNSPDLRPVPGSLGVRRGETRMGGSYEGRFFVAITGLVPYAKQFELYEKSFKGAAEYDTERDTPRYIGLLIERAEVQSDGSLGEWTGIDTPYGMKREPFTWESREEELADPDHILPGLTMPLPPIVLRDLSPWVRHSSVPMLDPDAVRSGEYRRDQQGDVEGEGINTGSPSWLESGRGGFERAEGGSGAERPPGAISENAEYAEGAEALLNVDNGMLRYFDFTAQPGTMYKYRVSALLDDPNNSMDKKIPTIASCESNVIVRRQAAEKPFRRTPWSEPSPSVVVPTGKRVLASKVDAPSTVRVGRNRRIRIERKATDEPTVRLMTLTWNSDGPYDVPYALDAARGSVLNGKIKQVEAIDPTVNKVRMLENFEFATDAMVLDIHGGLKLGSDLFTPGYVLIRTSDGRLQFRSEMDDFDEFVANTIPPDEDEEVEFEEESSAEDEAAALDEERRVVRERESARERGPRRRRSDR